jgi:hemin uptake protein HemP
MNLLDTHAAPLPADADEDALQHRAVTGMPPRAPRVRMITSEQLFADFPEVQIAHGDAIYRLRQTSLGKLILTK